MNIAIDVRCLQEKNLTGVGEYTYNLLHQLFKIDSHNQYFLFTNSFLGRIKSSHFDFNYPNVKITSFPYPNKLLNLCLLLFHFPKFDSLIFKKTKHKIDFFFFPNLHFFSTKCPYMITCHDLTFELYPQFFSLKRRLWHFFINPKKIYQKAQKVLAVSKNTENDLHEIFQLPKDKTSTIYPGIAEKFQPLSYVDPRKEVIRKKYNLPSNFIFFLGTIEPRKNITTIIKAFQLFKKTDTQNFHLIIAGKPGWLYQKILTQFQLKDSIIQIGYLDPKDKVYFFNLAKLFLFPSYYEGFGFPPLEAIACGCPTIISHTSSLIEVCRTKALSIDPYNVNDLYHAMRILLHEKTKLSDEKITQNFSWQKTAEQILKQFK